MPLLGNNAGAGKAGLFHRCCLGHRQANNNLARWVAALHNQCSHMLLGQKTSAGFTVWKSKQTNKKPLCNCLLIIKGKRQRRGRHTNPTKLEAHPAALPGHQLPVAQCYLQDCHAPALQHKHQLHIRGHSRARHRQHWPWMGGGQELAEVLTNDLM